jgi:Tfp pilus assembly protein PilE
MTAAACQERLFTRTHAYDADACAMESEHGGYTFSIVTSNDDRDFIASATPQGNQLGDDCGVLSINQAGVKTAGGEGGSFASTCWKGK